MKRINKYQQEGDNELLELFDSFAKANNKEFSSGKEVYDEYMKLNPMQQKQFLSTVKGQYNAQSLNNQEEIDENEDNVQDMTLMKYGGYAKAQVGKEDPRLKRIKELQKQHDNVTGSYDKKQSEKLKLYNQMNDIRKEIKSNPYNVNIGEQFIDPFSKNKPSPYQPLDKQRLNYNYSLAKDSDMLQSRDINVPFVKGKNVAPTELPGVTVTAPKLKHNPYRKKQTVTNQSTPYVADSVDEYYMQQANRLPDNIQPLTSKGTKNIQTAYTNSKPSIDKYINNQTVANTDNGFIGSNPVTIDYDNPDEARAIQYRKLKNSQALAPYRGNMTVQAPELYQESVTPYLDNIRESRNAMLQQINPNTSTGQAVLSNLYGQSLEQSNKAIGDVSRANAQNTTNWLNQRADVANKQQQFDYTNDNRYYGDIAQLQANQDEEDINYMNSIANMNAKRLQAKNSLLNTAIMTGLPDEALHIGDNAVTFDVSKIPHNFYDGRNNKQAPQPIPVEKEKSIMIGGIPHAVEYDENGKIVNYRKIPVAKSQYGGMTKYNFRKQKSQ